MSAGAPSGTGVSYSLLISTFPFYSLVLRVRLFPALRVVVYAT